MLLELLRNRSRLDSERGAVVSCSTCLARCPSTTTPPENDSLVALHPAQPASMYILSFFWATCHLNSISALGVVMRYLPNLLSVSSHPLLGLLMLLASSLTTNAMSGVSGVKSFRHATIGSYLRARCSSKLVLWSSFVVPYSFAPGATTPFASLSPNAPMSISACQGSAS